VFVKAAERACVGAGIACVAFGAIGAFAPTAAAQPASCPAGNDWPAKVRLEYDVTASRGPFSINGESVLVFERNGATYSINLETDSAAIYHMRQTSRGSVEPGGLRPDEYVEMRGKRTPVTTTFDWSAKSVTFSVAPDSTAETQPGLQDRATLPLQLAWLQRATPAATSFDVPLTGSRSVGVARFARQGVESVKVSLGTLEAVRFERAAGHEQDRIEAWFSAEWCGLPVRIRYTDKNGSIIDHRMRGARIE
jgi:hypothetical protein